MVSQILVLYAVICFCASHSLTDSLSHSLSLVLFSLTYSHPLSLWFPDPLTLNLNYSISLTLNPLPLSHLLYPSLGLNSSPSLPLFITFTLLHTLSLNHFLLLTHSTKCSLTLSLCNPTHFHTHFLFLTHSRSFPLSFIPCLAHSPSLTFYLSLTPHSLLHFFPLSNSHPLSHPHPLPALTLSLILSLKISKLSEALLPWALLFSFHIFKFKGWPWALAVGRSKKLWLSLSLTHYLTHSLPSYLYVYQGTCSC